MAAISSCRGLLDPGLEPAPAALAGGFSTTEAPEKPISFTVFTLLRIPLVLTVACSVLCKENFNCNWDMYIPGRSRIMAASQDTWASQVAQWLRTHLPMQESEDTRVQSLGWEEFLEKEMEPTPFFLPGKSMDRGACWAMVHVVAKSRTRLSDSALNLSFRNNFNSEWSLSPTQHNSTYSSHEKHVSYVTLCYAQTQSCPTFTLPYLKTNTVFLSTS